MVGFVQGVVEQCCTKIWELGQSEQMENVRQESKLEDEEGRIDGVQIDGEVLQALCKLFLKLDKQTLGKPMT